MNKKAKFKTIVNSFINTMYIAISITIFFFMFFEIKGYGGEDDLKDINKIEDAKDINEQLELLSRKYPVQYNVYANIMSSVGYEKCEQEGWRHLTNSNQDYICNEFWKAKKKYCENSF